MPFCIGWVENFDEILIIFGKNLKIQNGRHFGEEEKFLKIAMSTLLSYLWVENFDESALFCTVKEISKFVFFHFWQKFKNSKWPPYVGRGKFFENCQEYIP